MTRNGHGFFYTPFGRTSSSDNIRSELTISGLFRPFLNHFRTDNNLVCLFLDDGVDIGIGKASYEDGNSKTVVLFGIGVKPGVSLNLTENFSLVTHFGYLGYYGGSHAAQDAGNPERFGFDFSSMNLNL